MHRKTRHLKLKNRFLKAALLTLTILILFILPLKAQAQTPAPVVYPIASCAVDPTEPHPLRPYPGEICGPEANRTIDETDKPYCTERPWAAQEGAYMKNFEDCKFWPDWSDQQPCILRIILGQYDIFLNRPEYELPLVSITRDGSGLTFFNRAQQHLADYLEGRAYYDKVVEPEPDDGIAYRQVWNRLGVFRKLAPRKYQNELKKFTTSVSGGHHHDYIVGYISGGEVAPWGTGTPVRLEQFEGHYPPEYTCSTIFNLTARRICDDQYLADLEEWKATIYGKLWSYVPMFTREDAIGYVEVNPEPLQWFDPPPMCTGAACETAINTPVSIPHLPRLNDVSFAIRQMLQSELLEVQLAEESEPILGAACPVGPWTNAEQRQGDEELYYYNECERGNLCDLGDQFYSMGDLILDDTLSFQAEHSIADPPNPKIIPHPDYEEYKDYVCSLNACDSSYPSSTQPERGVENWWCTSAITGGTHVNRIQRCPNFTQLLPFCDLSECQEVYQNPGDGSYCEDGARRYCDEQYGGGLQECQIIGGAGIWVFPIGGIPDIQQGNCLQEQPRTPAPWMECVGGELGRPGTGHWQPSPFEFEQPGCENMNVDLKAAFTPGYVSTYTPYLRDIWENVVNQKEAIFTPFRTETKKGIYDWPGQSFITYDYPNDYAEAGAPPSTTLSGADGEAQARFYFRYLGYIHCAKENLLHKLTPSEHNPPYVYYDYRCDAKLW